MNSEKFAVFLDIDNTLMSGGEIPKKNIEAIKKVREKGSLVFINTARSFAFIPDILKDDALFDGYVAGIGTDLRLHGEQIFSHSMTTDELKFIAEHFINDLREISFEGEDHMIWIHPEDRRQGVLNVLSSADEFDTVYKDFKISKMYIRGHLTKEETEIFSKDYILYQHESYAEFVAKGYGKAVGMKRMTEYLDIPRGNCIAMGDSSNDADMLLKAGISVAMGNAIPEIKEICTYVSCDAKDGGVAEALEKFILKV
ncbi:MAG: HAD-IIB family hydrolase [Clostridia bacterium]|nr:HAD-IIB family hydrolase [Clostridia bacterium]